MLNLTCNVTETKGKGIRPFAAKLMVLRKGKNSTDQPITKFSKLWSKKFLGIRKPNMFLVKGESF